MNTTEYLVTHGYGTVIWTTLVFSLLFLLLSKFAWKPILGAVQAREGQISQAFFAAEMAQKEVEKMKIANDLMMKEAKNTYDQMLSSAKKNAELQANLLMDEARKKIDLETKMAVNDLKNVVAGFSVKIAEQIISEKLSVDSEQQKMIQKNVENIRFN